MSRYGSGFREPPWVIGSSKEVMDWMEATHPKKDRKDKVLEKKYTRIDPFLILINGRKI